jgi:hypothetical protein
MNISQSTVGLINQLVFESDGKRMKVKKSAETILKDIKDKLGLEHVEHLLVHVL